MKRIQRWALLYGGLSLVTAPVLAASGAQPATIQERARGAERIVVATVAEATARYERNRFGDELIITHARLQVEEEMKGRGGPANLRLEGGTVNGITMRVASLPTLAPGERAVFFLTASGNGEFDPHLRGQGILKLDSTNHVRGSSLSLDDVRRMASGSGK
ncbi:MAG: hypothetical protein ABIP65_07730 [Vicinamibacterales bacterium]